MRSTTISTILFLFIYQITFTQSSGVFEIDGNAVIYGENEPKLTLDRTGSGTGSYSYIDLKDHGTTHFRLLNAPLGTLSFFNNQANYYQFSLAENGHVGIGTTTPKVRFTMSNNLASGYLDEWDEYQILLWERAEPSNSYGIGIRPYTMIFNADSQFDFDINLATRFRIKVDGRIQLNSYTGTNFIGSPTHILGVDSAGNIVKTSASSFKSQQEQNVQLLEEIEQLKRDLEDQKVLIQQILERTKE